MKPVFLVGYMGAGKTTVGKVLAEQLGWEFMDLDVFIENRRHKSIKEIFDTYGEEEFRRIESRLLKEVCDFQDTVIACGGGTPCHSNNMDIMKSKGMVVYLNVPVSILFSRLSRPRSKAKRPVIASKTDDELMAFIEKNISEREIFYNQANLIFDTSEIETAAETQVTVARLVEKLKKEMNF